MRVNSSSSGMSIFTSGPMISCVAAAAEVAALAGEDDGLDVGGVAHLAEQVAQLAVGIEGERVLAIGPVERMVATLPLLE